MGGRRGIGSHTRPGGGETVSWLSPPELVRALGPFDLDPCPCLPQPYPTAARVIEGDGLAEWWDPVASVWLNPPYGRELGRWLAKLAAHGNGVALVFARTETRAFFESVWGKASALLFVKGRLHFHRPDGTRARGNAGGPSVLVAYGRAAESKLELSGIPGALVKERPCRS